MRASLPLLILLLGVSACGPSADNTAGLVDVGDTRACATKQTKELLTERLMTLVFKVEGPVTDDKGKDITKLALAYDPIVGINGDANANRVSCQAVAFLSLDGVTPYVANTIDLSFDLSTNLNKPEEVTISGNFRSPQDMVRIYFQNLGLSRHSI